MFKAIKTTIGLMIHELKEQKLKFQYIRAYKNMPETEDEIMTACNFSVEALADEPWE
jgi:hypothetical protein